MTEILLLLQRAGSARTLRVSDLLCAYERNMEDQTRVFSFRLKAVTRWITTMGATSSGRTNTLGCACTKLLELVDNVT
jgi:hypothetical protein